jgi:oligosaccharide translocation protein RFT1
MDQTTRNAVSGASLLVVLQLVSRAVTFLANQGVLRFLTPAVLGTSAQLEVLYLSVLFFARESLRVAIQRHRFEGAATGNGSPVDQQSEEPALAAGERRMSERQSLATTSQEVVNLGYIAIPLGLIATVILASIYLRSLSSATLASTPIIRTSLSVYAGAAMLELFSEPCFVLLQIRLQIRARATAEALGTLIRCIATLGVSIWTSRRGTDAGALPFALGQLCYSSTLLLVFLWYGSALASREGFRLLPQRLGASPRSTGAEPNATEDRVWHVWGYFYRPTLSLASSMVAQSFIKHLLTQGDTFMVSILSTPNEQGIYALANNYGGLAARLVFQPVEETSRSYFSRLLAPQGPDSRILDKDNSQAPSTTPASKAAASKAASDLATVIRCYVALSIPLTAIGPTAAPLVLFLIAGPRWALSGAGACLSAYVWYIPVMALNGVLEAFVASVATQAQIYTQSLWMGAFSVIFATMGVLFLRVLGWGAIGLVAANGVNMTCRIIWSLIFIAAYFRGSGVKFDLGSLLPKPQSCLVAAGAAHVVAKIGQGGSSSVTVADTLFTLAKIGAVAVPLVLTL